MRNALAERLTYARAARAGLEHPILRRVVHFHLRGRQRDLCDGVALPEWPAGPPKNCSRSTPQMAGSDLGASNQIKHRVPAGRGWAE
jgi:hypothetical protein